MEKEKVFVRKATGLVREWSLVDVFFFNSLTAGGGGIGYPGYAMLTALFAFAGGNILGGMSLGILFGVCHLVVTAMLASAMPRSGGDYIFQSRILHPVIGYIFGLGGFGIWCIWYAPWCANIATFIGIAPFLTILAQRTGDLTYVALAQWFMSTNGLAVMATLITIASVVFLILPLKYYSKLQYYLIGSTYAAIIGFLIAYLASSTSFPQALNKFMSFYAPNIPDYYNHVINTATKLGARGIGVNMLIAALGPAAFGISTHVWNSLAWYSYSPMLSGEIKGSESLKRQLIMIPGAGLINGIIWILICALSISVIGSSFLTSSAYLSYTASSELVGLPCGPYISLYAPLLIPEWAVIISFLLMIGFISVGFQWVFNTVIFPQRIFLAMAFDRVLPELFADVHPKWHTAHKSAIIIGVIALIFIIPSYYLPVWAPFTQTASLGSTAIPLLFTMIAGLLFPFLKKTKSLYASAPSSKYRIGPIPAISLLALIGIIYDIYFAYIWLSVPELGLYTGNPTSLAFVFGIFVVTAILYYIIRWYRKRQGIIVELAFAEIPPE